METRPAAGAAPPPDRVLGATAVYNEEHRVGVFVDALKRPGLVDAFVVVNDGSTDRGPELLRAGGIRVLDQPHQGLGAAIKHAVRYARKPFVRSVHGRRM